MRIRRLSHPWNRRQVLRRENSAYCFTLWVFTTLLSLALFLRAASRLLFSLEVENIADFPGEGKCQREDERDKQVLEHNKGVSIHGPALFICKPRGWPSVRIISSDFHDRIYRKWLAAIRVRVIARDDLFYRINGKFNMLHNCIVLT